MTKKDLIKILQKENVKGIEFEDTGGNTIEYIDFEDVDIADIDEDRVRLQLNTEL